MYNSTHLSMFYYYDLSVLRTDNYSNLNAESNRHRDPQEHPDRRLSERAAHGLDVMTN